MHQSKYYTRTTSNCNSYSAAYLIW